MGPWYPSFSNLGWRGGGGGGRGRAGRHFLCSTFTCVLGERSRMRHKQIKGASSQAASRRGAMPHRIALASKVPGWTISVGWKQTRQFSGLQCLTSIRRWGSATCRAFCAAFLVGVLASTAEDLWTSLERWPCFFHCVLASFCRGSGIPPFFSKFPRRVRFGASVSLLVCVLAVVVSCAPI